MFSASAVTAYEILDKLAIIDSEGFYSDGFGNLKPGTTGVPANCWQYVKRLSTYCFGASVSPPSSSKPNYLSGSTLHSYYRVCAAITNCGFDRVIELLKLSQPGDLVGFYNNRVDSSDGHIFFIGNNSGERVTVYQEYSGVVHKDVFELTNAGMEKLFSPGYSGGGHFNSTSYGLALFRCSNRTGQSDWVYSDEQHTLTVYYCSNYADKSFSNPLSAVGSDRNVVVKQYTYTVSDYGGSDGLHNYTSTGSSCYLGRTGYTGTGNWNTKYDGSGYSVNQNTGFSSLNALASALGKDVSNGSQTINLYPEWTQNDLVVNYYSNYADQSFENPLNQVGSDKNVLVRTGHVRYAASYENGLQSYTESTSATYLGRTGYTATGNWNTKADGSGISINQNTGFASGNALAAALGKDISNGNQTINLYPEWMPNAYTVTLDPDGGVCGIPVITVYADGLYGVLPVAVREGYTFDGWFLADGTQVTEDTPVTILEDHTLTAQWTQIFVAPTLAATSTAVLDDERGFLYGIEFGVTEETLREQYLAVSGDGRLEIETDGAIGTGTVIRLVNNETGAVDAEYTVVIFGDIDGDGMLTPTDITALRGINARISGYAPDSVNYFAADVTHDGDVNLTDVTTLRNVNARLTTLEQSI